MKFSNNNEFTGKRFGRLTVISYQNKNNWLCRCDCGTEKIFRIDHLKSGNTLSCGCHRREIGKQMMEKNTRNPKVQLSEGDRFNRWTVIESEGIKNHVSFYLCQCDCGTVRSVMARSLIHGDSKSCGCYHKEVSAEQAKSKFTTHGNSKEPWYIRWLKRRRYHADRNWTREMDSLLFQTYPTCVICGTAKRLEVDHVIPSIKGGRLEPGNVTIMCRRHNQQKRDKDISQLPEEWQEKITRAAQEFLEAWNARDQ